MGDGNTHPRSSGRLAKGDRANHVVVDGRTPTLRSPITPVETEARRSISGGNSRSPPLVERASTGSRSRYPSRANPSVRTGAQGGPPEDIGSIVDGALLLDVWPDLVLPTELRRAWQPILEA
jgi:hypothetical protein